MFLGLSNLCTSVSLSEHILNTESDLSSANVSSQEGLVGVFVFLEVERYIHIGRCNMLICSTQQSINHVIGIGSAVGDGRD